VTWNYLSENPLKKIKTPKVKKTFPVFISATEFKMILDKTQREYRKDLFIIALYTCMCLGELLNMKLSWIDQNQAQIIVKCSSEFNTKSKQERVIPPSHYPNR